MRIPSPTVATIAERTPIGTVTSTKSAPQRQLVSAIETVADGGSVMDAKVVESLITARSRVERSPLGELTPRELEILAFVARGHSNQAIADELVLTKRAVEKHINAIFLKLDLTEALDVSRRVKAALIYLAETDAG